MSRPKGTNNKPKGYALEHQENMISSGAAYELANSFRREAELYKKKFEQSEKQRDHYKALAEAAADLIAVMNVPKNEADGHNDSFLLFRERNDKWQKAKYQSLKTQTPDK